MKEEIKIKPTPIQRNEFDVAMELMSMYLHTYDKVRTVETLQDVFIKFYATVKAMTYIHPEDLGEFIENEKLYNFLNDED